MVAVPKSQRHGHARLRSTTYRTWTGMIDRCENTRRPFYKYYGGRGIKICDRWRVSFDAFLSDMGEKPRGMTLDRINNDGNYEPGNCRWASMREQVRNRRCMKLNPCSVRQIRLLVEMGYRQTAVARMFGVRNNVIWNVVHGVYWKDVR